jgi:hypothetical protein
MTTRVNDDSKGVPPRRRGGQEPPDDVQDRPEQNAGYDAAVRRGPAAGHRANQPLIDTDLLDLDSADDRRRAGREERAHDDAIDQAYGDGFDDSDPDTTNR